MRSKEPPAGRKVPDMYSFEVIGARCSKRRGVGLAVGRFGRGVLAAGCALAVVLPASAHAEAEPQMYAGAQAGFSKFAYVGGSVPIVGGFAVNAAGFAGEYKYRGGPDGRVDAKFKGAQVGVLYQYASDATWLNAGVAASFTHTRLSPFDAGNRRQGDQTEALLSVSGGRVAGPWRVDGYGSYGTKLEDYSVRGSLTHAVGDRWRLGLEGAWEGDPTYHEERVGVLAGVAYGGASELQVSAGLAHQGGRGDGGFVRIGVNHAF